MEADRDNVAIIANKPITLLGSPPPKMEVDAIGPTAMPRNLAELRKPMTVPFLVVPLPPRRNGGIPAWMTPIAVRSAIN